jgi:hypothetical protein
MEMSNMSNEKKIFYAAQSQIVIDTISDKGEYIVKKKYIEQKYGEVASVMLKAYDWFVNRLEKNVPKPDAAEYPVWLYEDPKYAKVHVSQRMIKLEIPCDEILEFDNRKWERVLRQEYIGIDKDDERAFEEKMRRQGVDCGCKVFENSFYPILKRDIEKSWDRLFDINEKSIVQAASWIIKEEWIVDIFE